LWQIVGIVSEASALETNRKQFLLLVLTGSIVIVAVQQPLPNGLLDVEQTALPFQIHFRHFPVVAGRCSAVQSVGPEILHFCGFAESCTGPALKFTQGDIPCVKVLLLLQHSAM